MTNPEIESFIKDVDRIVHDGGPEEVLTCKIAERVRHLLQPIIFSLYSIGNRTLASGTPYEISEINGSITGQYLKDHMVRFRRC
ncbi:hypothetical protein [Bacillus subtilis]|uniref:hypothetical protein n=1 Tax=Bacillus subtilis TaxID=1423 RepID=UPI000E749DB5|nr:hypothetical protein [Bacillus subtilis]RJS56699.1 hypothetical protein CJ481_12830 [Bacillus subtilis]RPK11599.1 hypothetical protein EH5_01764 [Bacillus subtilis]